MTREHRIFLWSVIGGGVVLNLPLNALLARLTVPPVPMLPLFARGPCVLFDTLGTSLMLPLITCLIVTWVTRSRVRAGTFPVLARAEVPALYRLLPASSFGRGLVIGGVSMVLFAGPAVGLLAGLGYAGLTIKALTVYKAIYSSLLGAVITPAIVMPALADPLPESA